MMSETEIEDRPFIDAIQQYRLILNKEINSALMNLIHNPSLSCAPVKLQLFDTIYVEYTKDGNKIIKDYLMHELHYGPHKHEQINNYNSQIWENFLNRDKSIWKKINKWLCNGASISPFCQRQIALLAEKVYLIDASEVIYDDEEKKYKFNIDISVHRKLPQNISFLEKHNYAFISSVCSIE